jgi:hypothetical protein
MVRWSTVRRTTFQWTTEFVPYPAASAVFRHVKSWKPVRIHKDLELFAGYGFFIVLVPGLVKTVVIVDAVWSFYEAKSSLAQKWKFLKPLSR